MNTTIDQDSRVNSILSMVDVPDAAPELPLATRARLETAKRTAYHQARAAGKTREEAETAAQKAYDVECDLIVIDAGWPAPIQTPPKNPPPPVPPVQVPTIPLPRPTPPVAPNIEAGAMDSAGAERSKRDFDAMVAAGFSPAATVYERGSRVNEIGVANARRSRVEHDAKPLVVDAATDLIGRIRSENRRIAVVQSGNIGMHEDGRIALFEAKVDGKDTGELAVAPSRAAFGAMLSRLGIGGADYLARLPAKARAANVNLWRSIISGSDPEMATEATMPTALEWVLGTILDELDAILDEKDAARGIMRTQAAREAGRKAMEPKVRAMLRDDKAADALRAAGVDNVRAAVRRMYELKLLN